MFRAIRFSSRTLRNLPRSATPFRGRAPTSSLLRAPSQFHQAVPRASSATTLHQLREFSITPRKLDSPSPPQPTIVRDVNGNEHNLTELAKRLAGEQYEVGTAEFHQKYLSEIKQGPLALIKKFLGERVSVRLVKMMRAAEICVNAQCVVTSPEELEDFNFLVFQDYRAGPSRLTHHRSIFQGTVDERFIAKIAEVDELIRTKEGLKRLKEEGDERFLAEVRESLTITEGMAKCFLFREGSLVHDLGYDEFIPGGPFQTLVKYMGAELTPEIAEELANSEPKLPGSGRLNPQGPTNMIAYRILRHLGLRDGLQELGPVSQADLEAILPDTVTAEVVQRMLDAEAVLKEMKGDNSPDPIPGGPAELMKKRIGTRISDGLVTRVIGSQHKYLGPSEYHGRRLYVPKSPATILSKAVQLKNLLSNIKASREHDDDDSPKEPAADETQPPQSNLVSTPAEPVSAGKLIHAIVKPPGGVRVPALFPPMDVLNGFLYNMIREWENQVRIRIATVIEANPDCAAASPTRLARENLGAPITRELMDLFWEEEMKLTNHCTQNRIEWTGPSNFLWKARLLENPPWLDQVRESVGQSALEYISDKKKFFYEEISKHQRTVDQLQMRIEHFKNQLGFAMLVLRDRPGAERDGRSPEELISMDQEAIQSDPYLKPEIRKTIKRAGHYLAAGRGAKKRLEGARFWLAQMQDKVEEYEAKYARQSKELEVRATPAAANTPTTAIPMKE